MNYIRSRHFLAVAITAMLAAQPGWAESGFDINESDDVATATISVDRIDLTTEQGMSNALQSIETAVKEVCERTQSQSAFNRNYMSDCQRERVETVVHGLNDPAFTAYYENQKRPDGINRVKGFFKRFRRDD